MSIGKYNKFEKYALVTLNGRIIEKFFRKATALSMKGYYHKTFHELLSIKELDEQGNIKVKLESSNN